MTTVVPYRFANNARARSVGPTDMGRFPAPSGDSSRCPRCTGRVFDAEKMVAKAGWFHRVCFRCFICTKLLDQTNFSDGRSFKILVERPIVRTLVRPIARPVNAIDILHSEWTVFKM